MKMKTGHHGANHPVKDLDDGRVLITSQNHGFRGDRQPAGNVPCHHTVACSTARCKACEPTSRPSAFRASRASPGPHGVATCLTASST